jgi:hypothetical protein
MSALSEPVLYSPTNHTPKSKRQERLKSIEQETKQGVTTEENIQKYEYQERELKPKHNQKCRIVWKVNSPEKKYSQLKRRNKEIQKKRKKKSLDIFTQVAYFVDHFKMLYRLLTKRHYDSIR